MIQVFDPVRYDAFTQLLARPDPQDLPSRRHVLRCEGDPNRRTTRFPPILMTWLQQRHLDTHLTEPMAAPVRIVKQPVRRMNPGLRVLQATG